jgi:hypothetical protein
MVLAVQHTPGSGGGEPWWVTALVAVGAALLGSFVGAFSTYRLNVALDARRREARAEIRRKAKIYTPIRAELLALRAAMDRDEHLGYFTGVLRADRGYHTMSEPPALYRWRMFVEDGQAMSSASARVRHVLDTLDEQTDRFNAVLKETGETFEKRGDAMLAALDATTSLRNWVGADAVALIRHRFDDLQIFTIPGGQSYSIETRERFIRGWEADEAIRTSSERLLDADKGLSDALSAALVELEAAMRRIATKHEHEPRD